MGTVVLSTLAELLEQYVGDFGTVSYTSHHPSRVAKRAQQIKGAAVYNEEIRWVKWE